MSLLFQSLQNVPTPIKTECIPEGCKIIRYQLNFNDANWVQNFDVSGGPPAVPNPMYANSILLNPQANTSVKLSQIRSISLSTFYETNYSFAYILDTGFEPPHILSTQLGYSGASYFRIPTSLPGDVVIKLTMINSSATLGTGTGTWIDFCNFDLPPVNLQVSGTYPF